MKNICVFCGSNHGFDPRYKEMTAQLGRYLVENDYRLIYGGGKLGLMGTIADSTLAADGEVIGIMPSFLMTREINHAGLTEMIEVPDMDTRKEKMMQMSDAFIVLPGGFGTFEEFFDMLSWSQMDLHQKPIALLNIAGFFDGAAQLLERSMLDGFAPEKNIELYKVSDEITEIFHFFTNFQHELAPKYTN